MCANKVMSFNDSSDQNIITQFNLLNMCQEQSQDQGNWNNDIGPWESEQNMMSSTVYLNTRSNDDDDNKIKQIRKKKQYEISSDERFLSNNSNKKKKKYPKVKNNSCNPVSDQNGAKFLSALSQNQLLNLTPEPEQQEPPLTRLEQDNIKIPIMMNNNNVGNCLINDKTQSNNLNKINIYNLNYPKQFSYSLNFRKSGDTSQTQALAQTQTQVQGSASSYSSSTFLNSNKKIGGSDSNSDLVNTVQQVQNNQNLLQKFFENAFQKKQSVQLLDNGHLSNGVSQENVFLPQLHNENSRYYSKKQQFQNQQQCYKFMIQQSGNNQIQHQQQQQSLIQVQNQNNCSFKHIINNKDSKYVLSNKQKSNDQFNLLQSQVCSAANNLSLDVQYNNIKKINLLEKHKLQQSRELEKRGKISMHQAHIVSSPNSCEAESKRNLIQLFKKIKKNEEQNYQPQNQELNSQQQQNLMLKMAGGIAPRYYRENEFRGQDTQHYFRQQQQQQQPWQQQQYQWQQQQNSFQSSSMSRFYGYSSSIPKNNYSQASISNNTLQQHKNSSTAIPTTSIGLNSKQNKQQQQKTHSWKLLKNLKQISNAVLYNDEEGGVNTMANDKQNNGGQSINEVKALQNKKVQDMQARRKQYSLKNILHLEVNKKKKDNFNNAAKDYENRYSFESVSARFALTNFSKTFINKKISNQQQVDKTLWNSEDISKINSLLKEYYTNQSSSIDNTNQHRSYSKPQN